MHCIAVVLQAWVAENALRCIMHYRREFSECVRDVGYHSHPQLKPAELLATINMSGSDSDPNARMASQVLSNLMKLTQT